MSFYVTIRYINGIKRKQAYHTKISNDCGNLFQIFTLYATKWMLIIRKPLLFTFRARSARAPTVLSTLYVFIFRCRDRHLVHLGSKYESFILSFLLWTEIWIHWKLRCCRYTSSILWHLSRSRFFVSISSFIHLNSLFGWIHLLFRSTFSCYDWLGISYNSVVIILLLLFFTKYLCISWYGGIFLTFRSLRYGFMAFWKLAYTWAAETHQN